MIKRLLLLTALLAPALAYGANLKNDFSVQIPAAGSGVGGGSGGGGVSSGGGGGSPTPPAAALAGCSSANGGGPSNGSCFNTLVFNMDFTTPTSVSGFGNQSKFNAQNISNWLDCSANNDHTSYMFYQTIRPGEGAPPCPNAWSIVNDGGTNALLMSSPGNLLQGMATTVNNMFPATFYVQWTMRVESAASEANCTGPGGTAYACQDVWAYDDCNFQTNCGVFELDFVEQNPYVNSSHGGNNMGLGCCIGNNHFWDSVPGLTAGAYSYHTLGERVTQDGNGNMMACFYYDGVQYNIGVGNSNVGSYQTVNNCLEQNWSQAQVSNYLGNLATAEQFIVWNSTTLGTGSGNVNSYWRNFQMWSCPNWTESAINNQNAVFSCAGALISSNP